MGEEALKLAKNEILKAIQSTYPDIISKKAESLAEELLGVIDWNNSALMHKGIAWITNYYLRNRGANQKEMTSQ